MNILQYFKLQQFNIKRVITKYKMGNKSSNQISQQVQQLNVQQSRDKRQISYQEKWLSSQKDLKSLNHLLQQVATQQWSIILRPFLKQISHQKHYQSYIRIILEHLVKVHKEANQTKGLQIFWFYKHKLEHSYFFVDKQFTQAFFQSIQQTKIQQRLLFLYEYSSLPVDYLQQCFVENFPHILHAYDKFVQLIIEKHIIIEDQVHFAKFIIPKTVIRQATEYAELCATMLNSQQRSRLLNNLKEISQKPLQMYIKMCQTLLSYKNGQSAELILRTLIQKGYSLSSQAIDFYFYVELYNIFLYKLISFPTIDQNPQQINLVNKTKCFMKFQHFRQIQIKDILGMFFSLQTYQDAKLLKSCFQVYQQQKITKYNSAMKSYIFSNKCDFLLTLQVINQELTALSKQNINQLEELFVSKLLKCKFQVAKYQTKIFKTMQVIGFKDKTIKTIHILIRSGYLFNKFGINLQLYEISYFMAQRYSDLHGCQSKKAPSQLQYLCSLSLKKLIIKYLSLEKGLYLHFEGKQLQLCIQTLFFLCNWLKQNLYNIYISLSSIHQLIFQQMLRSFKYDDFKFMLIKQQMDKWNIQYVVVRDILIHNVRRMLIEEGNGRRDYHVGMISADIKLQIRIIQQNAQDYHSNVQVTQIKALFDLIKKLDFYSISLSKQQKQNLDISLLYWLMKNYQNKIQVFEWNEIYRLILLANGKQNKELNNQIICKNGKQKSFIIDNQLLKFKIDLANYCYFHKNSSFGQNLIKQVLLYSPPWISSQLIKILKSSPQINQNFLSIAFQHCLKGQDLLYLLKVWNKRKENIKNKKNDFIGSFFDGQAKKFTIVDQEIIKDQKEFRNLVAQMTFNDDIFKNQHYQMFFALLGTEPQRAFYSVYHKNLDIIKIQIFLKQGMKLGVFKIANTTKKFLKLLYFIALGQKKHKPKRRISFIQFKQLDVDKVLELIQKQNIVCEQKIQNCTLNILILQRFYKSVKCLILIQQQFILNYLSSENLMLYQFLFDQAYRQRHLISLKDQPMGKSDIILYRQLCQTNNINILELILFTLTNRINTCSNTNVINQEENLQNMLQKIVTLTQNNSILTLDVLNKLVDKVFSTKMLLELVKYFSERENQLMRHFITKQHIQIIQSLSKIQINTQLYGIIHQKFFQRPILFAPKHKLSQKHIKLLKRQLKLHNVFLLSKVLYLCYGMSSEVEKQVLKTFVKENQDKQQGQYQQFVELKKKLQQMAHQYIR